jgi:hypothetical protein
MALADFLQSIEDSGFGTAIREGGYYFPMLESLHVIALVSVVGSIVAVDLRLLGLASREQPVTRMTNDLLPWTWGAFVVAAITGLMLFSSTPIRYFDSTLLRIKFFFMFLAGVNMLLFHFVTYKDVHRWDTGDVIPAPARLAGGLSLLLWTLVIFFGRWVGFTL